MCVSVWLWAGRVCISLCVWNQWAGLIEAETSLKAVGTSYILFISGSRCMSTVHSSGKDDRAESHMHWNAPQTPRHTHNAQRGKATSFSAQLDNASFHSKSFTSFHEKRCLPFVSFMATPDAWLICKGSYVLRKLIVTLRTQSTTKKDSCTRYGIRLRLQAAIAAAQ